MKELYFFDETFYWGRSGRRATVIEAECELTQSVRPDELRAAVVSALRVHRNFRARPVIVGRRFYVEDSEAEQVAVVSEADGLPRHENWEIVSCTGSEMVNKAFHRRADGSTYTITAHLKKVE